MNEILNAVSVVGFPIVMCGVLCYYIFKTQTALITAINNNSLEIAKLEKRMEEKTTIAHNLEEFQANMNKEQGFIKAMWCGSAECEAKIKELTAAKSRCMPFEQEHIDDKCVCCGKPADKMVIWGRQY
mgnify:CR=1 FL=1